MVVGGRPGGWGLETSRVFNCLLEQKGKGVRAFSAKFEKKRNLVKSLLKLEIKVAIFRFTK